MAGSERVPGRFQSGCDEGDGGLASVEELLSLQPAQAGCSQLSHPNGPCQMGGPPGSLCKHSSNLGSTSRDKSCAISDLMSVLLMSFSGCEDRHLEYMREDCSCLLYWNEHPDQDLMKACQPCMACAKAFCAGQRCHKVACAFLKLELYNEDILGCPLLCSAQPKGAHLCSFQAQLTVRSAKRIKVGFSIVGFSIVNCMDA